jgi:hypothetical protein
MPRGGGVVNIRATTLIVAVAIAAIATASGIRTGKEVVDTDELVYQRTLRSMRNGEGYYRAMSDAVAAKEGSLPASPRAIRPPTLFLFLRWFPESSWRWIVGVVYLAILLAISRLGDPFGTYGGLIATVAGGVWVIGASAYLYLHAELWGLAFFVAGLVAARRRADGRASGLILAATAIRETYGLGLLVGALLAKRRKPWLIALAGAIVLGVLHAWLAGSVVSVSGHQVALGNEPRTFHAILRYLSPGDRTAAFVLGIAMLVLGFVGCGRSVRDPAARTLLPFAVVMLVGSVLATRTYWNLTYAPAVSAFIPAALSKRIPAEPGT